MITSQKGLILKKAIKHLSLLVFMFAVSCMPKEGAVTQGQLNGDWGNFVGLDYARTVGATKVRLGWTRSNLDKVTGYNIYDVRIAKEPRLIKTVSATTSEVTIAGLSEAFLYKFRVRASQDDIKEDPNKKDLAAIPYTGAESVQVLSSTSARINFKSVTSGEASSAALYCKNTNDPVYRKQGSDLSLTATEVTLNALVPSILYTCKVNITVDGQEDNNLETVEFTALGRADSIVFDVQPGNGPAGDALSVQPRIRVLDENGNIVAGGPDSSALITLTVSVASPTTGAVKGTFAVSAAAGVADFTDLFLEEAGIKILTATKADTSSLPFGTPAMTVDSNPFNITPGAVSATHTTIAISPAPASESAPEVKIANANESYQVNIILRDAFGNAVAGIKPEFSSNVVGDFPVQPFSPTNASGETSGSISTTIADVGTAVQRILSISSPSGLTSVTTPAPFKAGPAKKLAFVVHPTTSPAGLGGLNEIQVAVQDQSGNTITSATDTINLSINNNVGGAVLSGTTSKAAVNGVAIFDDLGIDLTGNLYKLAANSGALDPGYSNNFNITAGIPKVIAMTGAGTVLSGACSGSVTLQLQDLGGNPANATQSTTVQISGLGSGGFYTSNLCGGTALSTNIVFSPGSSTRTLYFKSRAVENLTIIGTDASSVMTPSSHGMIVSPNKMELVAQAAPPAAPGTTLTVPAGQCSTAIYIRPLADDGSLGEVYTNTNVSLTGVLGSSAQVYSDAACTTVVDHANVSLSQTARPSSPTILYLKDDRGENLLLNVSDPAGNITTTSPPQQVKVLASKLDLVGPSNVVSGQCSAAFTLSLKDVLNNNVPADGALTLNVSGLAGSPTGQLYTSASCSGSGSKTSLTFPDATAVLSLYFRGTNAEVLDIQITDPNSVMTASQTVTLTVSPSDFRLTAPAVGNSKTGVCAGPFTIETLDGASDVAGAVVPITANLSGQGDAAKFFDDSGCASEVTNFVFATTEHTKTFYFKGQYPEASLTLTVTDNAGTLTTATAAWVVEGDLGWLGTASAPTEGFITGEKPVQALYNGLRNPHRLAITPYDPANPGADRFIYVTDESNDRIVKYNYATGQYVGHVGRHYIQNGVGSTGSTIPVPSSAQCVTTPYGQPLPGWCVGGRTVAGYATIGGTTNPRGITVDDGFVYVSLYDQHMIQKYNAETGAFVGWIGFIHTTAPTGSGAGNPATCTGLTNQVTPGWCVGGTNRYHGSSFDGDGRLRYPRGLVTDSVYLYVASERAIHRFDKTTGAHAGWIGQVDVTPTGGQAGCTAAATNDLAPGWCIGGRYKWNDPRLGFVGGARDVLIHGASLYVMNHYNWRSRGVINKYNLATGAWEGALPDQVPTPTTNVTYMNPEQFSFDGSYFYIADDERVMKLSATGVFEAWMGKVRNNVGMSGNPGCDTLQPNDNTPGWCLGGSAKGGFDETSFYDNWAIAHDGQSSLLAMGFRTTSIKKFDAATGSYQGALGLRSVSPAEWSIDSSTPAEYRGFDDKSTVDPSGSLVVGDYLFISEQAGSRIKKINKKTGEVLGWIGGITSTPTGGDAACPTTPSSMGPSPAWCLGANMYPVAFVWNHAYMITQTVDGIMHSPMGMTSGPIAGDPSGDSWLYVVDYTLHRVQRFKVSDGSYGGWIGRIGVSPTGGDAGCNGAPVDTFTPGWCLGGVSEAGPANQNGALYYPKGITYAQNKIFVTDRRERVSSFDATTGSFTGWIGRVGSTAGISGCAYATNGNYNVSTSGWCMGGASAAGNRNNDRGGGFRFENYWTDIFADATHLYITNFYNRRIDKFNIATGVLEGAVRARTDAGQYANTWATTPADIAAQGTGFGCDYPISVWADATHIYGLSYAPCYRIGNTMALWKMDKITGSIIGWKGGIADVSPTGGEPGCAGATVRTPGWCQGGRVGQGLLKGQFGHYYGKISGDDHFIYVTDMINNRVQRFTK